MQITVTIICLVGACFANEYPAKSIRLIVPAAPGGGADFLARIVGIKLSELVGQSVVVDNRAGASGTIAADATAKAAGDGYTVLMGQSTSIVIAPQLYSKLPYDTLKDLKPVTLVAEVPNVIVVHPSVPASTIKELIALAKAKPDMLNFGSSGNGAPSHLAGEMFKSSTGTRLVHVPYKGAGPAVNALLADEIQVMFAPIVAVLPQVKVTASRLIELLYLQLPTYQLPASIRVFFSGSFSPAPLTELIKELTVSTEQTMPHGFALRK